MASMSLSQVTFGPAPHLWKVSAQVKSHVPAVQTALELAGVGHFWHIMPQLFGSVLSSQRGAASVPHR
jgi:hypothetical protein